MSSAAFCRSAVHRGKHAQPALVDALPAEALDELPADLLLEIEAEGLLDLEGVGQLDLCGSRAAPRCRRRWRPIDTIVCSTTLRRRDRAIEVDRRRVARRRLDQAGEQRRFVDVQVAGGLAEVAARRRLDTIQAVAEIHLVQVQLEDLLLRV